MRVFLVWLCITSAAWADGEKAGEFDYYILSLSWSPNWCALKGDRRDAEQCEDRHDYGWVMHGLWPQFEEGWPAYCNTNARNPSRSETRAMKDIMGSSGLAWHQWKKHGRCSGLNAQQYFALSREAYGKINRPTVFRKLDREIKLPASVVEDAFLEDNLSIAPDGLTITCKNRYIQEARICFTKDLEPRKCGRDVIKDCTQFDAVFAPIR